MVLHNLTLILTNYHKIKLEFGLKKWIININKIDIAKLIALIKLTY